MPGVALVSTPRHLDITFPIIVRAAINSKNSPHSTGAQFDTNFRKTPPNPFIIYPHVAEDAVEVVVFEAPPNATMSRLTINYKTSLDSRSVIKEGVLS